MALGLGEAEAREQSPELDPDVVRGVEGVLSLGPARRGGRDLVHAMEADDLLDEVDFLLQVHPPGWDAPTRAGPGAFERPFETQRRQVTPHLVLGDFNAEHLSDAHGAQGDLLAEHADGPGIQHAGGGGAACQLEDEARGATTGEVGRLDVRAALETEAGVGAQPEGLAGAADVDGIKPSSLDEDVGGVGLDAGVGPAHDAGEGDALFSVGDQEHFRREPAGDAVEGGEGLALGGAADDDGGDAVGVAGEESKVEGVEGLPGLEHHEVGDVHDVVDGAEADHGEACLKPAGARPHADAAEDARGVAMAGLGGVDADGELFIDRGSVGGHRVGGFEGA